MVAVCQRLTCEDCDDWTTGDTSLLHLAAALGLTRLTCSLLHWVAEKPGRRLCREVDPLSQDTEGFTPLVRERLPCRLLRSDIGCEILIKPHHISDDVYTIKTWRLPT